MNSPDGSSSSSQAQILNQNELEEPDAQLRSIAAVVVNSSLPLH